MSEKLCVFCKNFDWGKLEYTYYSTLTGGDMSGGATCRKKHFFEVNPESDDAFRKLILIAQNCTDYDEVKP
ncbi:MAG TPA: hypothetical protein VK512_07705 [Xanthobacteraceae bacterium]|nr:hypothetical protein [Xanthobacteraceae bacterium]